MSSSSWAMASSAAAVASSAWVRASWWACSARLARALAARDLLGGVGGYGGDLGLGEVGVSDGPQFLQELGELVGEVFGRRGELVLRLNSVAGVPKLLVRSSIFPYT